MTIRSTQLIAYGALGLPLAMVALPVYVQAPAYYTSRLGMPLSTAGLILFLARLVDTAQDPFFGRWADTLARTGRLPAALWISAVCLAAAFAALWMPLAAGTALAVWFAAAVVAVYAAHSFMNIAYLAWGAKLGDDSDVLTRAAAWREGAGLVGVLIASAGPSWLLAGEASAQRDAMSPFIALFSVLLIGALWALRFAPPWQATRLPRLSAGRGRADRSVLSVWSAVRDNGSFRKILVPYFMNGLSVAIPASLAVFFIEDRLGAMQWVAPSLGLYFLAAALGLPLWVRISRRVGPQRAWGIAMSLAIMAFVWTATLGPGDLVPFLVACAGSGFALGADLALPAVLLAQCIPDREGSGAYFGIWTLTGKLCLALSALILPGLAWLGYQPGTPALGAPGMALALAYAGLPCLLKLGALMALRRSSPTATVTKERQ
ncbi:Sugar transporter [Cupriavidus sp. U2]|uniref:MFS transporter n=1 Tax=Cupriavidus sp. U2 TaxID=2920269 RepID=UPI00129D8B0F|nr:MFS transporter [Cupriavidus sp. U2]KAI3593680.1 Sugar transporter [Cupriavidus sp. U2]